jgi:predicted metal-dependent HD superfamily phosphohydrolase
MNGRTDDDLADRLSFDCPRSLLARLRARYQEPHRRYHTWAHVLACVDARHRITQAAMPDVDLALLFHDAIYEPFATDNEAKSAALLVEEGRRAWLDDRTLVRAAALVRATKHDGGAPETLEGCIVVDSDLSILGSDPETFDRYEAGVREEYAAIDDGVFASGRGRILRPLLARPSIFWTAPGQSLWEGRAQANLRASLAKLETYDATMPPEVHARQSVPERRR